MKLRLLLVDDEPPARRRLIRLLGELDGAEVVGEAGDAETALALIQSCQPDLLLLDLELPGMGGLALARQYRDLPPFIFVTADHRHALEGFDLDAVDYLVKPVRPERLAAALDRARLRLNAGPAHLSSSAPTSPAQVRSATAGEVRIFLAREVVRFSSRDKYTLFRHGGIEQLTDEPLTSLAQRLSAEGFLRLHRAELVRASAIRALLRGPHGWEVELTDGQRVSVSRRSLAAVREALGLVG